MRRCAAAIAFLAAAFGTAPASAGPETIVVGSTPGFAFAPPVIVVPQGTTLTLAQIDPVARHDLVSRARVNGRPLFGTPRTLAFGEAMPVARVEKLRPATYAYVCTVHDGMMGQLIIK